MATYAAYRHIELDKVGYGKKRVLKPPGGGTSDIFGAGSGSDESGTPARRIKNHQASNVFLSDDPAPGNTPSRNHGKDTYSRLFGPPLATPTSAAKNKMRSNILLSDAANRNCTKDNDNIDGSSNGDSGRSDNVSPQEVMNGNTAPPPTLNGNTQPAQRNRVPPGGFSSGLW